jgi:4'-phosphopantetheinyl transferase
MPDSCTVWWLEPGTSAEPYWPWLDQVERDRAATYRTAEDQARSAAAAALLRRVAGVTANVEPADIQVDRDCTDCGRPHGRPRLPGLGLHASVSHAGNRVAVALTAAGPVGVDVERVRSLNLDSIGRRVLGPGETATTVEEFAVCWTRKEAVVKATGHGITVPLRRVLVSAAAQPPALRDYLGRPMPAAMTDLNPGDGYVGCVAVLTTGPVVVEEKWATAVSP